MRIGSTRLLNSRCIYNTSSSSLSFSRSLCRTLPMVSGLLPSYWWQRRSGDVDLDVSCVTETCMRPSRPCQGTSSNVIASARTFLRSNCTQATLDR